jgi:hypothetical protein
MTIVTYWTYWYRCPLLELGTPWDPLGPLGTPWDPLGPLGTPWDPLGPLGTPWTLGPLDPVAQWPGPSGPSSGISVQC